FYFLYCIFTYYYFFYILYIYLLFLINGTCHVLKESLFADVDAL
ncbi:unnamed protein product, partial [Brassica oleracea]